MIFQCLPQSGQGVDPMKPLRQARVRTQALFICLVLAGCLPLGGPEPGPETVAAPTPVEGIYCARLEQVVVNGVLKESRLTMAPCPEEFRAEDFQAFRVSGRAPAGSGPNPVAAAAYEGVSRLLAQKGLFSVISRRTGNSGSVRDEVRVRYEGVVRMPMQEVLSRTLESGETQVEATVRFSPLSTPDRWKRLSLKKRFADALSFFSELF